MNKTYSDSKYAYLEDGVTPKPEIIERYIRSYTNYAETELGYYDGIIMNFLEPENPVPVNEEAFASIMLPLMSMPRYVIVATRGLYNPYCPASILSAACRSERAEYRRIAVEHPNCRVEDQVYASLLNGEQR